MTARISTPASDSRILFVDMAGVLCDFEAALAARMFELSSGRYWVPVHERVDPKAPLD